MHFGADLKSHLAKCRECDPSQYVNYSGLKRAIKQGCTTQEFQRLYHRELHKVVAGLHTSAPHNDPQYITINRMALDKISKKFDKRRKAELRSVNREVAKLTLGSVVRMLPIEELPMLDEDIAPSNAEQQMSVKLSKDAVFAAGAVSGIVSRTSTAPLDRIKIILQVDATKKKSGAPRIPHGAGAMRGAIQYILKDGGVRGFWRGNFANVLKVTPESATKFFVYDLTTQHIFKDKPKLNVTDRLTAGCIAGAVSQLLVYPLDVTKTRLAASKVGQYQGILDCLTKTVRHEGVLALFKGVRPALAAIIPASGVDLSVYNTLREAYCERQEAVYQSELEKQTMEILQAQAESGIELPPLPPQAPPITLTLAFGAVAATCGAIVAYPLTLIRTKLIAQGMPGQPVLYKGAVDCAMQIARTHGIVGFYRGIAPALMKAVPAVSIGYGAFEATKILLLRFGTNG